MHKWLKEFFMRGNARKYANEIAAFFKLMIVVCAVLAFFGLGFCAVLTIVFVVLKCFGKFDHSWLTVFLPLLLDLLILIPSALSAFLILDEHNFGL